MKKLACVVSALVFVLCVAWSGAAFAAGATGNINLLIGQKYLDDDLWDDFDLDEQDSMGLMFDLNPNRWPVSLALDFLRSEDEGDFGVDGETQEIDFGVRWYSNPINRIFQFYVGGGLGLIAAEVESEDDDEFGVWINGGLKFVIAQHLNLGLDLHYSMAEVDLDIPFYDDVEAGGLTTSLAIGYHF